MWGGQDPDSQAKAKLSAELKDQVGWLVGWSARASFMVEVRQCCRLFAAMVMVHSDGAQRGPGAQQADAAPPCLVACEHVTLV